MRQMVTEGFYDRSRIGLWLFEVIGREWDDMAQWARTLRLEAFPQTCTWSIAIWEFVYGYEPDGGKTLEWRRARILAHKWSSPPINPARIEAALSALTGCPVHITEHVAPYTFQVVVDETDIGGTSDGSLYDFRAALRLLRRIKPSHLSFRYESYIAPEYEGTDYDAGAITEYYRIFYDERVDILPDATDCDAGTAAYFVREFHLDINPITDTAASYDSGAMFIKAAEVFTANG
jgi:hypothetical protein